MTENSDHPKRVSNPFNYWALFAGVACSPIAVHFLGRFPHVTNLVVLATLLAMFSLGGAWSLLEKLGVLKPSESLTLEQRIRRGRPAQAVLIFLVGHGIGFAVVHLFA
jgi:hypothetical protein